jgi:hypothetical protein
MVSSAAVGVLVAVVQLEIRNSRVRKNKILGKRFGLMIRSSCVNQITTYIYITSLLIMKFAGVRIFR